MATCFIKPHNRVGVSSHLENNSASESPEKQSCELLI